MRMSFKLKLILAYTFVILVSFGLVSIFLDKNLEENSLQDIKHSLLNQAQLIENQIVKDSLDQQDRIYLDSLVKRISPIIKCRLTIISNSGIVLADSEETKDQVLSMENHLNRPEIKTALSGTSGEEIRYSPTLKIDMLYVAIPVKNEGKIIGVLRLALPLSNVQKMLGDVRKIIFIGLLFALGLAVILGYIFAGSVIKSINKIIQFSRRFAQGDFRHKILHDTKDEIGELAQTLNKMAQDIEDKVKEVSIHNQQLAAIFNSMIEGVIVIDKEMRIISVNPTAEKIFGIKKNEMEGRFFLEAIRNNDIADEINKVLINKQLISKELTLTWPLQRIFQVDISPLLEKDLIIGCLLVIHDVTEIRKLETVRKDFVANVSHELKTPLTSIKGFVETLLEENLDNKENSLHFLGIIRDHANRLDNLINDLLQLSYIESREVKFNKEEVDLKELSDKVLLGFKSQLYKKGIKVENNLTNNLLLLVDKGKIEQVLTNLIDNAIKFNNTNGSIQINSEESAGKIKIVVIDSGIGIPAKDLPRIFERFYRVDKARSRELGGTGLGLSIVKHIVELHNGSVGVESTEGFGSKFWFTIPK